MERLSMKKAAILDMENNIGRKYIIEYILNEISNNSKQTNEAIESAEEKWNQLLKGDPDNEKIQIQVEYIKSLKEKEWEPVI